MTRDTSRRKWRIVGLALIAVCLALIGLGVWWIVQLDPAWLRGHA